MSDNKRLKMLKSFLQQPTPPHIFPNNSNVINQSFNSFFAHLYLHFNLWLVISHDRWLSSFCYCLGTAQFPYLLCCCVFLFGFLSATIPFPFVIRNNICVCLSVCVYVCVAHTYVRVYVRNFGCCMSNKMMWLLLADAWAVYDIRCLCLSHFPVKTIINVYITTSHIHMWYVWECVCMCVWRMIRYSTEHGFPINDTT